MIPDSVKAISFDAGGTLLRPRPSVGHVYARAAKQHGWGEFDPELLTERFVSTWKDKVRFGYTRADWAGLVAQVFDGLVESPNDAAFFNDLYRTFAQPDHWHVFPDVQFTLETLLQSGFRLLVISNWDERLHSMLESLGIANHFSLVVVSLEAGSTKPDPAIFHHAARRMRLSPDQMLHIGDSQLEDVEGAASAGMHALRVDRSADLPEEGVVSSLLDIVPIERMKRISVKPTIRH